MKVFNRASTLKSLDPQSRRALKQIGVPSQARFRPDRFQVEALEVLKTSDVIVTAPTGSGKTWIAEQAILRVVNEGKRAWYASPLKALSNSIFSLFQDIFGPQDVGILTGDRKENTDAPIIVGTTEILRNQLYDAMHRGEDLKCDLVVIDEAHYLGDIDRGVVWEEVLIYLPSEIKLLMLSATIENSLDIADWLKWHRRVACKVVAENKRSVPLYPLFLFPDGRICPLEKRGRLYGKIDLWLKKPKKDRGGGSFRPLPPFDKVIGVLRELNLLPVIFFLKSRSDCNKALTLCDRPPSKKKIDEREAFRSLVHGVLSRHPYIHDHRQFTYAAKYRVAAHHGGQLPRWKQFVEDLMKGGHLDAIFSTSTVAAGVNFPARTVAILQSDRFNGTDFNDLTATDLAQMTGRAGRRGMDQIGFALMLPGPYQNIRLIQTLLSSPPNPVESQIKINFSMILNLLLSHYKDEIHDILKSSLATYQQVVQDKDKEIKLRELHTILEESISGASCDSPEQVIKTSAFYKEQQRKIAHVEAQLFTTGRDAQNMTYLTKGRLFRDNKGKLFCCIKLTEKKNSKGLMALLIKQQDNDRVKVRLPARWMKMQRVSEILDKCVHIPEGTRISGIRAILENERYSGLQPNPLDSPIPTKLEEKLNELQYELDAIKKTLKDIPCYECVCFQQCFPGKKGDPFNATLRRATRLDGELQYNREFLWRDFLRHLEFLKKEGYVDEGDQLTKEGIWTSRLRVDHPLLMAHSIRKGLLSDEDPALLAAMLAPFVNDRGRDVSVQVNGLEGAMLKARFNRLMDTIKPLVKSLNAMGFPTPAISFWPMPAIYRWARGGDWKELVNWLGLDEGDMAMLIFRTADHLRQMIDLEDVYPGLAQCSCSAVNLLIREPVLPD